MEYLDIVGWAESAKPNFYSIQCWASLLNPTYALSHKNVYDCTSTTGFRARGLSGKKGMVKYHRHLQGRQGQYALNFINQFVSFKRLSYKGFDTQLQRDSYIFLFTFRGQHEDRRIFGL